MCRLWLGTGARQLVSEGLVDPEKSVLSVSAAPVLMCLRCLLPAPFTSGRPRLWTVWLTAMFNTCWPSRLGPGTECLPRKRRDEGAKPFGEGFEKWLRRSPGFRLENVKAPLLVNAEESASLLFMWEPYAALRYLHKPVDLVVLNTDEHVLTNPAVRMVSQGGTVDWFRFWLKGEEDSEPSKAKQYTRWRELRRLQAETEKDR